MGQKLYDFVLSDGTMVKILDDGSVEIIVSKKETMDKLPPSQSKEILIALSKKLKGAA